MVSFHLHQLPMQLRGSWEQPVARACRPFHKPGAGCTACPRCWRSRRTAISSSYPIEQTPTSGFICRSTPTTDAHAIPAALPSPARAVALARVNAALSELVQTSSVVQHRQRGRSRRRSGSRRAPAARAAVDCSFAPGAVTSAARIASLDHAWSGSVGGVAAMATEQQSWSSRRAWPFRLGHVESALDRASCNSRVGVVVTGGGSAPLPQRRWGRGVDAQERIVPEPMASPGQDRPR